MSLSEVLTEFPWLRRACWNRSRTILSREDTDTACLGAACLGAACLGAAKVPGNLLLTFPDPAGDEVRARDTVEGRVHLSTDGCRGWGMAVWRNPFRASCTKHTLGKPGFAWGREKGVRKV